MWSEGWRET